jgi:hypothetical protein
MTDKDTWEEQYGQVAYNAYWDSASGKTFDGRSMPRWDQLGDAVRSHWVAAATRVATRAMQTGTNLPRPVSRETSTEEVPDGA